MRVMTVISIFAVAVFMTACAAQHAVGPATVSATVVSVEDILQDRSSFAGTNVTLKGYVCWSENYEQIYGIYGSAEDCKADKYVRAIELLSKDISDSFPGKRGIAVVSLSGVYNWCETCVSTGPINNGYIQVESLKMEAP